MPRLTRSNPRYQHHRASGQAVVTLDGRDFYLGPHGTAASKREYDRLVGEWLASGRRLPRPAGAGPADLAVVELVARYWRHAKVYYGGGHGGELGSFRLAIGFLRRLYGRTPVIDFGPLALKVVRQAMVDAGWSRRYVNRQVERIRRMFRWGVEQELVRVEVYQALRAVEGLRLGRTSAREPEPVRPVPEQRVHAIEGHVSRQVWAMVQLQLLTGMRAGEVVVMRSGDVDTSGRLWLYTPRSHKTQHHGHERTIYLGPQAQAVLAPMLKPDLAAYIFSPAEAEAERREKMHSMRATPLSCGNVPGSNRRRRPRRAARGRYTVDSYRRAIAAGCEKAFAMPAELRDPVTPKQKRERTGEDAAERRAARAAWYAEHVWSPGQLRHTAGTRLRREFGLEAAQVILGHRSLTVTQVYAEKNVAAAQRIMSEVG
jgi:integrase